MPSVRVQEYELEDLFKAYRLFERVASGELVENLERGTEGAAYRCSLGGESYYTWIGERSGSRIARVHYVRCGFGHVIGVWPSALKLPDVTLYRRGHQRRPEGW